VPQAAGAISAVERFRILVALGWTNLIMVLCWMPRDLIQELEGESSWFEIPHLDKVVHWALFVIFSILWLRVLRSSRRAFGLVILLGLGLGVLTEIVQGLAIIGRDTSVADMITDGIGVVVGVLVAPFFETPARYIESRLLPRAAARPLPVEPAGTATEAQS
jgi:VanZ family protein